MANKAPKFTMYNVPLAASKYGVKAPYSMSPIGITIHETDNNASARNEIAYMQRNNNFTSFHFAVDEKEVIQGVPLNRNTWNAGDAHGNGNRKTISIEICRNYRTSDLTNYRAARKRAEELTGWLMYVYGWDAGNIYTHNDWTGKNCPRVIRQEGYLNTFKANAIKHRNSYRDGTVVKPTVPSVKPTGSSKIGQVVKIKSSAGQYANVKATIPEWVKKKTHTIKEINSTSTMVLLKEINSWVKISDIEGSTAVQPTTPKPVAKTLEQLADEVLANKHGNGQDRKNSLGKNYQAVMDIVNARIYGKPIAKPVPKPTTNAKIDQIAKEILYKKHNYGSGTERKKKLGKDYAAVQARINAILAGDKSTPAAKPQPTPIKVGDMVVVRRGAADYNGRKVIPQWYTTKKVVSEIRGNRAVLDIKGWATAFKITDLIKR